MKSIWNKKFKTAALGIATGFANGLFGAGGGALLVPGMQRLLKLETHKSHATAIAVILPLSALSAVVYLRGVEIDWRVTLFVSAGGVAGGLLGAKILNKLSGNMLHIIFGAFMIAAAIRMIL